MKAFYVKKDGMVLCSAIDKFVYAIVKERFDDMIYINYSEKDVPTMSTKFNMISFAKR